MFLILTFRDTIPELRLLAARELAPDNLTMMDAAGDDGGNIIATVCLGHHDDQSVISR